jgi:EAL domain-containing protein (putative c-di-GMP-specific phosphodiesterase class I)
MRRALRRDDLLAHLGGDEFAVVLPEVADTEESWKVLNRLLKVASGPVELDDRILQVSISAGVTYFPQKEETDADQLLRQANQAMYVAKVEGRNRYHIFDPALDRSVRDRHESLERIRLALAANEFVLFYQPKVNMCTGAVLGAEALIRWQHPERGLLPPGEFLPVIEGHPIAVEVGKWVIENALIQMEKWRADGVDVPVSVNIGADQLQQADFVDSLNSMLVAHFTIPAHMLELELLESSSFRDVASTSEVIRACKRLGVSSALDDFGTGYATLTYLKRLPVDVLKIDQTFVRDMLEDPEDMAILEGMLGLATAFRCATVAEGVETVEHGLMLLRLGCQVAQGYGIARPMQAQDLPAWAAGWHPDPRWKNVLPFDPGNRPVLYAGVEHRAWVVAIEDFLDGKRDSAPVLDLNQCRFGIWLRGEALVDGVVLPGRGGLLGFRNIDALHQKIHALADQVLSLGVNGRKAEAMARIDELHALRDDLFDKLDNLLQQ